MTDRKETKILKKKDYTAVSQKPEEAKTKELPSAFINKMNALLKDEAEAFFKSYGEGRRFGLRINPLKRPTELPVWLEELPQIPWSTEGRYYDESIRPGKHPLHEAGLYYIQEPSAQACAEALAPKPGECVLDLCAAPGGKSTHLAGKMEQKGLIVCNEIHPARAKILAQNVERMGIANAVVTNMAPDELVPHFPVFFDRIAVDAPCSGEGMFRKDENARGEWSEEHVRLCAKRQEEILECAAKMLKGGGRIVYSTCTFSPEENEQTIERFLRRHPDFHLERPLNADCFSPGRPEWADGSEFLKDTVRIWPHKTDGEGHFMALLVRENKAAVEEKTTGKEGKKRSGKGKKELSGIAEFETFEMEALADSSRLKAGRKFINFGDQLYLIPEEMPELKDIRVLRPGLHVGTIKKGRLEPSHALALFLKKEEAVQCAEIGTGELAERYLRGEAIPISEVMSVSGALGEEMKGWTLVTAEGISLGFAKADRGTLKNHYPKGLRRP